MKRYINFYTALSLVLLVAVMTFSSCKKEKETDVQKTTKLLTSGTWKISSVKVDGVDQTSSFTGLTLQFQGNNFTTTNGKVVWPASGVWIFTNDTASAFSRPDGIEVTITSITESKLVLQLIWTKTTFAGGRTESIGGTHVFEFTK